MRMESDCSVRCFHLRLARAVLLYEYHRAESDSQVRVNIPGGKRE